MFNVSRGSHRRAVPSDATQAVSTHPVFPHFGRWAALASWLGALMSAISEYGLDVDFPLTPSLWLDPKISEPEKLLPLLKQYPSELMEFYPVSRAVNSPANDNPACIVPL